MVGLLLSFIKYVHTRQRNKARRRVEIDRSSKERIANDNATKRQALSMAFYLSNPICSLVISIAMLGSTRQIITVAVAVPVPVAFVFV